VRRDKPSQQPQVDHNFKKLKHTQTVLNNDSIGTVYCLYCIIARGGK
jgi:hypothetical protein